MSNFKIDPQLARLLLQAQGDPITDLKNFPDSAFAATSIEAGERVVGAIADLGYRFQRDRGKLEEDDGTEPGSRMPIARIAGFQCAWIDESLVNTLAYEFKLDASRHIRLLGALLVQFFAHARKHPVSGDFGVVQASTGSGELSIDLAKP